MPDISMGRIYGEMAAATIDSIYKYYSVAGTELLSENYPFDANYVAGYLSQDTPVSEKGKRPFAFLWPYSGTLSMVTAMMAAPEGKQYRKLLDSRVLPGLEQYFDTKRQPAAYASYIVKADPRSGRFYDDNDWVGLDFIDLYMITKDKKFLRKAEIVWKFIEDGTDQRFGGGVYWSEDKRSKNTCSSAPAAVLAMKLFEATGDKKYLEAGRSIYGWTKATLQDKEDYLYFDNIGGRSGRIDRRKFSYNSGQMLQAAALLYKATGQQEYLTDAKNIAASCYDYFFRDFQTEDGESFRILRSGNTWFHCIMFRGFVELYRVDKSEKKYIDAFAKNLLYIWKNGRSPEGLFSQDFSGRDQEDRKWLLAQTAMAEMYARMAALAED